MAVDARQILKDVLELPPIERASIADQLLSSLDRPDETVDALWRKEVESRLSAYREGKIKAVPLEEVLAKYRK